MDSLAGRQLGPYDVHERLGRGGMATVYRATHRLLDHQRALKILSPTLAADESFVTRFQREARIAAGLRHPNIVQIFDVGEHDGYHYIAMALLVGRSLRELIRQEAPVPLERAVRLLEQLAAALDYAHARGVAHRDVKPANAFVGPDDRLTLVDFGIARAAEESRLTATGMIVGTAEYMSPETIQGQDSGPSTDLYALGIVAYELLTGRVPFSGASTPAILLAQATEPPPSPRTVRADLPAAVEVVLLRQLAKSPADRYPTGRALVAALAASGGLASRTGPAAEVGPAAPTGLGPPTTPSPNPARRGPGPAPRPGPAPGTPARGTGTPAPPGHSGAAGRTASPPGRRPMVTPPPPLTPPPLAPSPPTGGLQPSAAPSARSWGCAAGIVLAVVVVGVAVLVLAGGLG